MTQTVNDICAHSVISVPPTATAGQALEIMRELRISCILVADDNRPLGIFTERDVVRQVAARGLAFLDDPITLLMSRGVVTISGAATLYEAFARLMEKHIRHLVVADGNGEIRGVLTQSDLMAHLGYEYFVTVQTVAQVMNRNVLSTGPGASVLEASRLMADRRVSFVVVQEEDRLPAGVLSERDVARLAAEERDLAALTLEEAMSRPVITLPAATPAFEAAEVMRERHIRRLVVVDESGRTVGVATQSDMIRGLESKYIETLKRIIRDQGQELERAVRDLSEKTLYLDSILSSAMDMGIVATDTCFRVVYASDSATAILGHEGLEALGRNVREIHETIGVGQTAFDQIIAGVTLGVPHSFSISRGQGQAKRFIDARISAVRGQAELMGYVLTVQDVTQRKLAEETIRYLAYHDTLTGLPNRALFSERLVMDLARCRRQGTGLTLCVLDLDRFKEINDGLGHHVGDEVLRGVGQRLARRLRETDTVARMGGDEFMVILPDLKDPEAARATAEKLVRAFDQPLPRKDGPLAVRLSLGAARFPEDGLEAEDLMRLADRAMYQAKELGRANGGSNLVFCG